MDLLERIFFLVVGGCLGYILARIVDQLRELRERVDQVEKHDRQRNEDGFMRRPFVADLAYLFALSLILIGLYLQYLQSESLAENYEQDRIARCQAGVENRNVQRQTVDAVYSLASGVIERNENDPPLTQEETMRVNAYIERVNAFRDNMYDKIKPSEECAPYVNDDNVRPPTPPLPPIKFKEPT